MWKAAIAIWCNFWFTQKFSFHSCTVSFFLFMHFTRRLFFPFSYSCSMLSCSNSSNNIYVEEKKFSSKKLLQCSSRRRRSESEFHFIFLFRSVIAQVWDRATGIYTNIFIRELDGMEIPLSILPTEYSEWVWIISVLRMWFEGNNNKLQSSCIIQWKSDITQCSPINSRRTIEYSACEMHNAFYIYTHFVSIWTRHCAQDTFVVCTS